MRLRRDLNIDLTSPVRPFDLAADLGLEVRFVDISSMEGMYIRDKRTVLIAAARPAGRQSFTLCHEIGHHLFSHGLHISQLIDQAQDSRIKPTAEVEADAFAAYFLMPKATVLHAFRSQGWDPTQPKADEVYRVAIWLGVGYETLLIQLRSSFRLISGTTQKRLLKIGPRKAKKRLLAGIPAGTIHVVDDLWPRLSIDLRIGDVILLPDGANFTGDCIQDLNLLLPVRAFKACVVGEGTLHLNGHILPVRCMRPGFVGRSIYRYLPEI